MEDLTKVLLFVLFITQYCYPQWEPTNGPGKGPIISFAVSRNKIFAGTYEGIYFSTDDGTNWTAVDSSPDLPVYSLVATEKNIFAGTNKGIYLSTDSGISWINTVNNGLPNTDVYSFTASGSNIFAGTKEGVYLTTNYGLNWIAVNNGMTNLEVNSLAATDSSIFAATNEGVYLSTDNGSSWTVVNNGLPDSLFVRSLAISGNNIVVGTILDGIYLSTDNGASWTGEENGGGWLGEVVNSFVVNGNEIFAGTEYGIFASVDYGRSWTEDNNGINPVQHIGKWWFNEKYVCSLVAADNSILVGTISGVYRLNDNETNWTLVNNDFSSLSTASLATSGNNIFAGTYEGGVYLSTDNGTNWTAINNGLTNKNVNSLAVGGNNIFVGTNGGVYLSTNNGENWTAVNNGLPYSPYNNDISLAVNETSIFAASPSFGVYLSTNNGKNWQSLNYGLPKGGSSFPQASLIAIIGDSIFVGLPNGLYRSTDNGTSWTQINSYNGLTFFALSGSNFVAADEGDGMYVSTDNGTSWTTTSSPDLNFFSALSIIHDNIFVSVDGYGIFLSTDKGNSWKPINDGFPNIYFNGIDYRGTFYYLSPFASNDNYIFTGTGDIIWRRPLSGLITDVKNNKTNLPLSFSLSQNFPNPFNPSTAIRYFIPKTSFVSLKVYDVLGREITILVDGYKQVGKYEIEFNGNNLSSGIYFYRLQAGDFVETKKMILLK